MDFFGFTSNGLKEFFKKDLPCFRVDQIFQWIYEKGVDSFEKMSNLSKDLRCSLDQELNLFSLQLIEERISKDRQSCKFLFKLKDGYFIESVLISSSDRRTLCISSQVGCKGRCVFCASGKDGFKRDLSSSEIVEQVVLVNNKLKEKNERISNIVFMGMGEPLDNFENVINSIHILNDKKGLNISQRKITISTVGLIDKIQKLKELDLNVNLTLSLHAPNQMIRERLIPFAKKNNLEDLLRALKSYFNKTKRDLSLEYILIGGINDRKEDAKQLIATLFSYDFKINLIPYNKIEGSDFKRTTNEDIVKFKNELKKGSLSVTQRFLKGDDISAACGQLAMKQKAEVE